MCNKLGQRFIPWLNVLYIGYFSKSARKPAKFEYIFCSIEGNKPAWDHCVFLLDVSLTSIERVLGRTFLHTHRDSSGFFYA